MRRFKDKKTTVIITDKHSNSTKVFEIRSAYIRNIGLYKGILLSSIFGLLFIFAGLGFYIYSEYQHKRLLKDEIVAYQQELDNAKIKEMHANLEQSEQLLANIKQYIDFRNSHKKLSAESNLENNNLNVGGADSTSFQLDFDFTHSKMTDLSELYNLIQRTPLGLPHDDGRVSSKFGRRRSPTNPSVYENHSGMDFRGKTGDSILSTASGKVIHAAYKGAYGNCVIIEHRPGCQTLFGHLSKILVKKGDQVVAGDKIGLLGSTGRSTGPHLHYEVIIDGKRVNPDSFIHIK